MFATALAVIATLLAWWAVFSRALIVQHTALQMEHATSDAMRVAASEKGARQLYMITGEGAVFGILLIVCVAGLFVLSVGRRNDKRRMERLLQFTTHELKTPIAGVKALLQSMQLGSVPEDARARFLDQGLVEMNRLEHLAETILAYQRASSQAARPTTVAQSRMLVDAIVEHRRRSFGEEHAALGALVDVPVHVEPDGFRVVLENLLDNARKYGGARTTLDDGVESGRYRLRVIDHGVGFDPKDAARLFDPFDRAEAGAAVHGSGLGLFISRQLMRQMGGELTAHSDGKGRGATFTIELPLAEARRG